MSKQEERVVALLNAINYESSEQGRFSIINELIELLCLSDAGKPLLPSYFHTLLDLVRPIQSVSLRRGVSTFIEKACSITPDFAADAIDVILFMLRDASALVVKAALSAAVIVHRKVLKIICTSPTSPRFSAAWESINQIKAFVLQSCLEFPNDGVRIHAIRFVESLLEAYTVAPSNTTSEVHLNLIPDSKSTVSKSAFSQEADYLLNLLVTRFSTPHLPPTNSVVILNSLQALIRTRPSLWKTLLPSLCSFAAPALNPSVNIVLRNNLLTILRIPAAAEYRDQLFNALVRLNAKEAAEESIRLVDKDRGKRKEPQQASSSSSSSSDPNKRSRSSASAPAPSAASAPTPPAPATSSSAAPSVDPRGDPRRKASKVGPDGIKLESPLSSQLPPSFPPPPLPPQAAAPVPPPASSSSSSFPPMPPSFPPHLIPGLIDTSYGPMKPEQLADIILSCLFSLPPRPPRYPHPSEPHPLAGFKFSSSAASAPPPPAFAPHQLPPPAPFFPVPPSLPYSSATLLPKQAIEEDDMDSIPAPRLAPKPAAAPVSSVIIPVQVSTLVSGAFLSSSTSSASSLLQSALQRILDLEAEAEEQGAAALRSLLLSKLILADEPSDSKYFKEAISSTFSSLERISAAESAATSLSFQRRIDCILRILTHEFSVGKFMRLVSKRKGGRGEEGEEEEETKENKTKAASEPEKQSTAVDDVVVKSEPQDAEMIDDAGAEKKEKEAQPESQLQIAVNRRESRYPLLLSAIIYSLIQPPPSSSSPSLSVDNRKVALQKVYLEAPLLTPESLAILQDRICQNNDILSPKVGADLLRQLCVDRPALRRTLVPILLTLCVHPTDAVLRAECTRTIVQVIYSDPNFTAEIETIVCTNFEKCHQLTLDTEMHRYMLLLFMLCTKNPSVLIPKLAESFARASPSLQNIICSVPDLMQMVRRLGSNHPVLLQLIANPHPGAEKLSKQIASLLFASIAAAIAVANAAGLTSAPPSRIYLAACYALFEKTQDVSVLLPIIGYLSKEQAMSCLPHFVSLDMQRKVDAMHKLFTTNPASPPVSPAEWLMAAHLLDPAELQTSYSKIAEIVSAAFAVPQMTTEQIGTALQAMLELPELPTLYMRTLIQSLNLHTSLMPLGMVILSKLVDRQIWNTKTLWDGWIMCAKTFIAHSKPVILQLPGPQLSSILDRIPDLKSQLIQFVGESYGLDALSAEQQTVLGIAPVMPEPSVEAREAPQSSAAQQQQSEAEAVGVVYELIE